MIFLVCNSKLIYYLKISLVFVNTTSSLLLKELIDVLLFLRKYTLGLFYTNSTKTHDFKMQSQSIGDKTFIINNIDLIFSIDK